MQSLSESKGKTNSIAISKNRFDDHLSRKFFHMVAGTVTVFLYLEVLTRNQSIFWILLFTILSIFFELLRLIWPALNRMVLKIFGPLMRQDEADAPSAQLFYLIGLSWAYVFLPKILVVQAVLTLAWMDPVAGIFGVRFGRKTWNQVFSAFIPEERRIPASLGAKTVEGTFAGFLAAFFAGLVAWTGPWAKIWSPEGQWVNPDWFVILLCSFVGAITAAIAEAWPSQWDDNAKIPFWTGIILLFLVLLAGIPVGY